MPGKTWGGKMQDMNENCSQEDIRCYIWKFNFMVEVMKKGTLR